MIKDAGRSEGNTGKSGEEEHAGKFREDTGIIMEIKLVSEEIGGDLEEIQEEPKETIAILHGRFVGIQGDSREKQGIPGEMKRDLREIHRKFREDTGIIKEMQLVSKKIRGDLEEIQEEPKEIHCYPEWKIQGDTGRFGGETWNSRTNEKRTKGGRPQAILLVVQYPEDRVGGDFPDTTRTSNNNPSRARSALFKIDRLGVSTVICSQMVGELSLDEQLTPYK
nr:hypothetical protein GEV33_014686 [Tenebrio molitor]